MGRKDVLVVGLPSTCNPVKLKLRFQSECKVKVLAVNIGADQTIVSFENSEDADQFCEKIPPSIMFGNLSYKLSARKLLEDKVNDDQKNARNCTDEPDLTKTNSWYDLDEIPKCNKGLLIKSDGKLLWSDVKEYFEDHSLSRGGKIVQGINMIDGLLILFEQETTVDEVWQFRPHRVGKLSVVVYIKYVPRLYTSRLIIKANQDYSEDNARTDLELCIPKNSAVSLGTVKKFESSNILVDISNPKDEKCIQEIMEDFQKSIKDTIHIKLLPKSDCIKIDGLPDDMSDFEITSLFENKARSGGGPVTSLHRISKTSALLYFASFSDVGDVGKKLGRDGMVVFGKPIKASCYLHCLYNYHIATKSRGEFRVSEEVIQEGKQDTTSQMNRWSFTYGDIKVDLLKFLSERPDHLGRLKELLHPACVTIKNGMHIEGSQGVSVNIEECKNRIKNFLEGYVCEMCNDFGGNAVAKIRKGMLDYRFEISYTGNKNVAVRWTGDKKCQLVCVGCKDDVELLLNYLKDTIKCKDSRMILEEGKFRWTEHFKILENLRNKDIVKISTDVVKQEVRFSGNSSECAKARHKFTDILKEISCEQYQPKTHASKDLLLKTSTDPEISHLVHDALNRNDGKVLLVVTHGEILLYGSAKRIAQARLRLDDSLFEQDFRNKVGGSVKILFSTSSTKAGFLQKYHNEFKYMAKKHSIEVASSVEGLLLRGDPLYISQVVSKLRDWVRELVESTLALQYPGISEFLKTETGLRMLSSVGDKYETQIAVNGNPPLTRDRPHASSAAQSYSEAVGSSAGSSSNGIINCKIGPMRVCVKPGDISMEKSDAIVNWTTYDFNLSRGNLLSAMSKETGAALQKEINLLEGNGLRVSSGASLSCSNIVHVVCPFNGSEIEKIVLAVLKEAGNRLFKTLSFPVIMSGDVAISNTDVAECMTRALETYASGNEVYPKQVNIIIPRDYQLHHFRQTLSKFQDLDQSQKGNRATATPSSNAHGGNGRVSFAFGDIQVTLRQGDITREKNDAIVNSTGSKFDLSVGMVSQAIIKHGGHSIQSEVRREKGHSIRITYAGRLPCKHIIHVVTPYHKDDLNSCLYDIFHTAEQNKFKSISMPALGTGNMKMHPQEIGQIFSHSLRKYCSKNQDHLYLKIIDIVIFDRSHFKPFCTGFASQESETLLERGRKAASNALQSLRFHTSKDPTRHETQHYKDRGAVGTYIDAVSTLLDFCSTDRKNINQSWSELDSMFKIECIVDAKISSLTPEDQSKLVTLSHAYKVSINISKATTIAVSGLNEHVDNVVKEIKDLLQKQIEFQSNATTNSRHDHGDSSIA